MEQVRGGGIFIEVFLSKTLVNIEMAPSIHDALLLPQLNNSWPPQGCIFFSSYQLSCLYILTKHVASDDRKRYNSWKEIRATHKLGSELYSITFSFSQGYPVLVIFTFVAVSFCTSRWARMTWCFLPSLWLTWTDRESKGIIFSACCSFRWVGICKQELHLSMLQSDKRGRRPPEWWITKGLPVLSSSLHHPATLG